MSISLHECLQSAIKLRQEGEPAVSLALLDEALKRGEESPWIDDNRARAYVDLNQRGEAIRLWQQLSQHSDSSAAAEASKMLELHLPLFIQEVHATLQRLALKHTWTLRHLGESTRLTLQDFTTRILREAIETRDHGQAKLSLELIEAALSAGLTSPWFADNQARALVHLHRLPEAVAIWEELSQLEDSHIRDTAQKMVKHFWAEAARQTVFQQADTLLEKGNINGAVQLLESPGSRLHDENLLLTMAKRLRESNQAAASLALLDAACKQNEQGSPWMHDSRANSLWLLNRRLEALKIWEQLQHHPDPAVASAAKARLRPPTQDPLWLCYLDGEIDTSVHSADPITCGVRGWILHTTHTPDGLKQPTHWDIYLRQGAGLPFVLDCRLNQTILSAEDCTRAAAHLAPWLVQPISLRILGHPALILDGADHLDDQRETVHRLREAVNEALEKLGCDEPLLILCWSHNQIHGADAVIDSPLPTMERKTGPLNYEVFLKESHYRTCPYGEWRIPAVIAPTEQQANQFVNASPSHYNEWLHNESSWSQCWLQGTQQAPVVISSWMGHQRWYRIPEPPTTSEKQQKQDPTPSKTGETSWGLFNPQHLALFVHGYHLPILERILSQVPGGGERDGVPPLDLYLTVPEDRYAEAVTMVQQLGWPRAHIFSVVNRGRDIAAFLLHALPAALASGHETFIKVHTKASSHLGKGKEWSDHLLNSLLCTDFLHKLSEQLEDNELLGLLAPAGTVLPITLGLGRNAEHLQLLCTSLNIPNRALLQGKFIAGTMMAGRMLSLQPLAQIGLSLNNFDIESGQTDGTMAHAVERIIGAQALHYGWKIKELSRESAESVPSFGYSYAEHEIRSNTMNPNQSPSSQSI